MKAKCYIEGCANECGKRSDICTTCKKGLRYWDDRDHADVLERQRKLTMWNARLATLVVRSTRRNASVYKRAPRGGEMVARH